MTVRRCIECDEDLCIWSRSWKRSDGTAAADDADVIGNTVGIGVQTFTCTERKDSGNEARTVPTTEPHQALSKASLRHH